MGSIITSTFLEKLRNSHREECNSIKAQLQNVCFQSEDNRKYVAASRLLIRKTTNTTISTEECLLVAFAPDNHLLHQDYVENSLEFFLACREQRETVDIHEIVRWAIAAITDSKKQAVREYLGLSERRQDFASVLRNCITKTWLETDEGIQEILKVSSQQEQLERALQGKISWSEVSKNSQQEDDEDWDEISDESNPDEILDIHNWWQTNHGTEIQNYNERLYPVDIDELKQRLQNDERSAWLMLFFLGAAHTMGRTKNEQHRGFINLCLHKGWWETFSAPKPQDRATEWMSILNDYMESQSDDNTWNYWMEKFPVIYRIASYLDAYIAAFRSVENILSDFDLRLITVPRSNPAFQGGGSDAPPLPIGIGVNFVLRELVRLEILQPTTKSYVHPHCFVPKANVRRALMSLGCEDLNKSDYRCSRNIYQFLQTEFRRLELEGEPTFYNCFDIPFELYSKHLELAGIRVREDIGWYENISEEEHRQYELADVRTSSKDGDFVTLWNGRVIPRAYMH